MSREDKLDLDSILAEFHAQEKPAREGAAAPERASRRESLPSAPLSAEDTRFYRERPARHAAPEPAEPAEPAPPPAPQRESPAQTAPERRKPEPAPKMRKSEQGPVREQAQPQQKEKQKKAGHGKGFALMFLVLLALAAILAGLLRWTGLKEQETLPPEQELLRLDLGESLEQALDESAGSSR